jgi:signal peptidase I
MEPTLHCARPAAGCRGNGADRLVVDPVAEPDRGDVVVFETPPRTKATCGAGGTFVMRVVGLPGETLEELDGYMFADGRKLDEPYVKPQNRDFESGRWSVGGGAYFVLGDNRSHSCDSRRWGSIAASAIKGRVVAVERSGKRIEIRP